jgi:hypothetical protein
VAATEFLHTEVGLMRHCDIKLRNLVWFPGPKKFKIIGFGAAQGDGNHLQKRTTAKPTTAAGALVGACGGADSQLTTTRFGKTLDLFTGAYLVAL